MKKLLFLLLAIFAFVNVNSQIKKPVKWTAKTEKISDTEFNLVMNATIEQGWHMYSQFTPDGGPLPITVTIKNQKVMNLDLIQSKLNSFTSPKGGNQKNEHRDQFYRKNKIETNT